MTTYFLNALLQIWGAGVVITMIFSLEMLLGATLGSFQKTKSNYERREDRLFAGFLFCAILLWFVSVPYFFFRRYRKSKDAK